MPGIWKEIKARLRNIGRINREAEELKIERENQRIVKQLKDHQRCLELIMRGGTVRGTETEKEMADEELLVDYMSGPSVCGEHVTPMFIRPFGLRRDKF